MLEGVSYRTALRRYHSGDIGSPTEDTSTGRKFVLVERTENMEALSLLDASLELINKAKIKLERN